ncbi:transposase, partial [Aeromonas media]|uniref:transposase n=1 Tax=Aeromonas media TaxID=651 RepID=UPI003D02B8E4
LTALTAEFTVGEGELMTHDEPFFMAPDDKHDLISGTCSHLPYIIHKSKQTERWLKKNPKFCLVFQPVYSPWVNHIERLWHKLHETITRNHQCRGMASLLARVKHFMDTVSPFPGNGYGTAKV